MVSIDDSSLQAKSVYLVWESAAMWQLSDEPSGFVMKAMSSALLLLLLLVVVRMPSSVPKWPLVGWLVGT